MTFIETELGFYYEQDTFFIFFGKRDSLAQKIQTAFPLFQFYKPWQIHSSDIVTIEEQHSPTEIEKIKADGLISQSIHLALMVATADCLPILIFDPVTQYSAAIHAGWRGVVNQITMKAIRNVLSKGAKVQNLQIFIGPHIAQESFAVDVDVKNELVALAPRERNKSEFYEYRDGKYYVNLYHLLVSQLSQIFGIAGNQLKFLECNTYQDLRFHSFRRDKEMAGRQLSFIVRRK